MPDEPKTPRIFISYSWTSDEHVEWVADLGQRLMSDGIDVVLDRWSLKDGQDKFSFMESMVTDPSINRVIVVSDARYAAKADGREGGVGTETQILSKEIYDKVDQKKIVALLRERDEHGNECLPTFLANRKYIDCSNVDLEPQAYDDLIRNIFERPALPKPPLGKAPSHIFDESASALYCAQKAKRFIDAVKSGKGNTSAAFDDFVDSFMEDMKTLRMTYSREKAETWCDELQENIARTIPLRDQFVDVMLTGLRHEHGEWFLPALHQLLERVLEFRKRANESGSGWRNSEDNYRFLIYELTLYTISAFIKSRRYSDARQIMCASFVTPEWFEGERLVRHAFEDFNPDNLSLDEACAKERNRYCITADFVKERAVRSDIRFSDLAQADAICLLVNIQLPSRGWLPKSLLLANRVGHLELFLRGIGTGGFQPLRDLLDTPNAAQLVKLSEPAKESLNTHGEYWHIDLDQLLCLDGFRKQVPSG